MPSLSGGLVVLTVLMCLCLGEFAGGELSGIQAVITKKGLDYLTYIWVPIVKQELAEMEVKNFSGDASFSSIKVQYYISNINVSKLDFGASSITSDPKEGIILFLNKSSLAASADWQFQIGSSNSFFKFFLEAMDFSDHGSLYAWANGVQLRISVLVSSDQNGHPRISATSCSFQVDDFNVTLTGKASPFYNQIIDGYKDKLQKQFNDTVCKQLKRLLDRLDNSLAAYPVVVPLHDDVSGLDISFTQQPVFKEESITTQHKGAFVSTSQPNRPPNASPSRLPSPSPSWNGPFGKMAYIQCTEYMVQTALQVYMRAGLLRYDVTGDSIKDNGPFLKLDTTTLSLIIPQLFYRFGPQDLMLTIRAIDTPPNVVFVPGGADIGASVAIDVYVVCNNSNSSPVTRSRHSIDPICDHNMPLALTLGVTANLSAKFWLGKKNGSLYLRGNADNLKVKLDLISTNVGDFDVEKINKVAKGLRLIDTEALPQINDWAYEGIQIPDLGIEGLTLKSPQLNFQKGFVTLETDISFKPKFEHI